MATVEVDVLKIALGQVHCWVGGIEGNCQKILDALHQAHSQGADAVLFPELTLTGYPPEDLLFRPDLHQRVEQARVRILAEMPAIDAFVGLPSLNGKSCYNSLAWLSEGQEKARYHKQELPNYGVFDEKRYFVAGEETCVVELKGYRVGLLICEDVWHEQPAQKAKQAGADLLLVANASPYHAKKTQMRHKVIEQPCFQSLLQFLRSLNIGRQSGALSML